MAADRNVGKVSVVGSGLLDRTEWTARMTAALSAAGIASLWTCVSQQRASVVTQLDRTLDAVRLLHQEFGLSRSAVDGGSFEAEAS